MSKFLWVIFILAAVVFIDEILADYKSTYGRMTDVDEKWKTYTKEFNKSHLFDDENRKNAFINRDNEIRTHNSNKKATYRMNHNQFSDFNDIEVNNRFKFQSLNECTICKIDRPIQPLSNVSIIDIPTPESEFRNEIRDAADLRQTGCIGPVKDEENCTTGWVFASMASFEFMSCKENANNYKSLSEQQVIDCIMDVDTCSTDWPGKVANYLATVKGSQSDSSYPYTSGKSGIHETCKFSDDKIVARYISNKEGQNQTGHYIPYLERIIASKEKNLMPPTVFTVIMSVVENFLFYEFGVYQDPGCNKQPTNHAVAIVGYGESRIYTGKKTPKIMKHWTVRNSWGPMWGHKGYFLIKKGVNMCNIESYYLYFTSK